MVLEGKKPMVKPPISGIVIARCLLSVNPDARQLLKLFVGGSDK